MLTTTVSKKLRAHLKSIAAKGGAKGGKARMEALSAIERRQLAIRATMGKLGDQAVTLWLARCTYRGNADYVVMGCAEDPEQQFRRSRKKFPSGVQVTELRAARIKAPQYIKLVEELRQEAQAIASWPVRALVQVARVSRWMPAVAKPLSAEVAAAWLKPKKQGRPRKDAD